MTVPHDPAHQARLSYTHGTERWHLMASEAVVVVISPEISRSDPYSSEDAAESAFRKGVIARIEKQFPGWTVWTSDEGHWYATRDAQLSNEDMQADRPRTVEANTPDGLAERLVKQHTGQAVAS